MAQTVAVTFPNSTPDPLARLVPTHPRLIASAAQFEAIANNTSDPVLVEVKQRIIATATASQNEPLQTYTLDPVQHELLNVSRAAFQDIVLNAMAYQLTKQPMFAVRARDEMVNVAGFPDWDPTHFLSTGEMAMGVALGYDWIYNTLSPQDRTTIEEGLMTNALVFVPQIYGPKATSPGKLPSEFQWVLGEYNWNQVCNGGLLAAALAIADVQPVTARTVIQGVRAYLPIALEGYAPSGAWFEGPVYMSYATGYTVLSLSILQSALGTDFGLSTRVPALSKAGIFHLEVQSPSELLFNYGDAESEEDMTHGAHPAFGWLATRFSSPTVAAQVRANLAAEFNHFAADQETGQYFALHALWLPKEPGTASQSPLDANFSGGANVAVFRSSWTDPNAIFLGFKAGTNGFNHSHLDLGSFVFDSDGIRWSLQLGPDSYGLPEYNNITPTSPRWTYFRANDYSKSTLVPGHTVQSVTAVAPIYSFTSTPAKASAVANLTAAYPMTAQRILRGVFLENRSNVLIQDDITELKPNTPLVWQMLTMASISISPDGHTATLTQKQKTLRVQLLSPANATFNVASAAPPTSIESANPGCSFLVATVPPAPKAGNVRVAVLLSPIGSNWPANPEVPELTPLPIP